MEPSQMARVVRVGTGAKPPRGQTILVAMVGVAVTAKVTVMVVMVETAVRAMEAVPVVQEAMEVTVEATVALAATGAMGAGQTLASVGMAAAAAMAVVTLVRLVTVEMEAAQVLGRVAPVGMAGVLRTGREKLVAVEVPGVRVAPVKQVREDKVGPVHLTVLESEALVEWVALVVQRTRATLVPEVRVAKGEAGAQDTTEALADKAVQEADPTTALVVRVVRADKVVPEAA